MNLAFKNNSLQLKDVDTSKRIVSGYFAAFGNVDSDGDVMTKGAFTKTITENKARIAHLLQHNINQPIGKLLELEEDNAGLRFTSKMSESTLGNDTLIQYQEGILREHSIGFVTVKEEPREKHNEILEVKLWEGSTVTFGANPITPVTGIKSQAEKETELQQRFNVLTNFLRKGKVSDDAFRLIEFEVERIKQIMTLNVNEPPKKHSENVEPSFDFNKFSNLLNS